ncbi:B12-binding domain-containing radical SAM protein [Candidatus Parcubacteria bacterium]|nr:B12-binding domain-containing radical SAM protein [Candidatus Parcubacteria bacterium]
MLKKVLLISSSFEGVSLINASDYQPSGVKTTTVSHYPLGFAYLHSYLEPHGYDVRSLFLNNYDYEICFKKVAETMEQFSPEVAGFQIFTANRVSSYHLIEFLHKKYPNVKLIIGGIHATIMHKQLIKKYPFLIAVLGEGEATFFELIKELSGPNPNLTDIDGIAFYYNNFVIKTKSRELIENLDDLPFPKHEEFFKDKGRKSGCIITSRGCPFNCSFCCLESISRRRSRLRSAKNVVDEIEMMVNEFPQMTRIWVQDDNFFVDNKRVINICDEIIRRKIKMNFICSARIKPISQEIVKKLEQAGFNKILFGMESGNDEILRRAHKNITKQDAREAIKLFSNSKIIIGIFLIVGLPGETMATIKETANFIKELQRIKYFYISEVSILIVYPGTEVYEIAKDGGMINYDYWLSDSPTPLFTLENSKEQLFAFKNILLNHISLDNFFLPAGFKAQFIMIPHVIKYVYHHKTVLRSMASRAIKITMPEKIFKLIKKMYNYTK